MTDSEDEDDAQKENAESNNRHKRSCKRADESAIDTTLRKFRNYLHSLSNDELGLKLYRALKLSLGLREWTPNNVVYAESKEPQLHNRIQFLSNK